MSGQAVLRDLKEFERLYRMWGETNGGITHATDRKAAEEISAWTGHRVTADSVKAYRYEIGLVRYRRHAASARQESLPLVDGAPPAPEVTAAGLILAAIDLLHQALAIGGEA